MLNLLITKRNLKKAFDLTRLDRHSHGSFSSYFKYNKTQGIKVLISPGHPSIKSLRKSNIWRAATRENTLLKKAKKLYQFIPISYGVVPIRIGKKYYPGIVMQHINGKLLCKDEMTTGTNLKTKITLRKMLYKLGIIHNDLHGANIILCSDTNKYYVLDFDPEFIQIFKELL